VIRDAIGKLIQGHNLAQKECFEVMREIMTGQATPSQIAGFLIALRVKGETSDEIAGCALAMREAATPLVVKESQILDSCGTGGDDKGGLNISTAAAFVVAGAGYTVAKHGNRAVSSQCGSADVLEAMGVKVACPTASVEQSLNEAGIGFLFAPNFHPAMKHAMPTRKELGVRTVFNLFGPLTNPAKAKVQLIGVFEPNLTKMLATVMMKMGHQGGLVVHSQGWDEITLDGSTLVCELLNKKIRKFKLSFKDFGLPRVSSKTLKGGNAQKNAEVIMEILEGKPGMIRHVVIANAAALIWVAERAFRDKNFKLRDAVKKAQNSLETGSALKKFRSLAEISHMLN